MTSALAMDRTERISIGIALAGHILLFGLLSYQFGWSDPLPFRNPPMAVDIIAESAPVSTAPVISDEAPAARLGDPDADEAPAPPPAPPQVREQPRPEPRPEPVTRPRAQPQPTPNRPDRAARVPAPSPQRPAVPPRPTPERSVPSTPQRAAQPPAPTAPPARQARDNRPSGALDGIAAGVARDAQRNARATTPPAVQTAAEIRADIRVSINNEVRGPWNACRVTGIDVDQLKTTIVFRLTQAGGLDRLVSVNTSGVNDSNRPQVDRFEECARRAIQLAAPFANLPAEHYSYWQTYTLDFEKR